MRHKRKLLNRLIILSFFSLPSLALAQNAAILAVNNQATIDVQTMSQSLSSYSNQSDYAHVQPSNQLSGQAFGGTLGITKTFERIYSQVNLGASSGQLGYTDNGNNFSNAKTFTLNTDLRVGYSFYPTDTTQLTPFVMAGYRYWQIDSGGINEDFGAAYGSYKILGYTQLTQSALLGIGLLEQWAVTPRWVLSFNGVYGTTYNPWTRFNAPETLDGASAVVYQQANLTAEPFYQLGVMSDYLLTPQLHGRVGVQYEQIATGSGNSAPNLDLPVTNAYLRTWTYSAGIGYVFGGKALPETASISQGSQADIIKADNQAKLSMGYLYQNYGEYNSSQSNYLDRQQGGIPQFALEIDKTFNAIYTAFSLSTAVGNTQYVGSLLDGTPFDTSTRNTILDTSIKLGYMFFAEDNLALTPYLTIGYHRWLRDTAGTEEDGYQVNGYPETYQHYFYGAGLLTQWTPLKNWVLSLDTMYGRTYDPTLSSWNSFNDPITTSEDFNLGTRPVYDVSLSSDYRFAHDWHLLTKVDYQRFGYGASQVNSLGTFEPNSDTRQIVSSIGIGYSF